MPTPAEEAKKLHTDWQNFKNGKGATMIKDSGIKLNAGLGPSLDKLSSKWGSKDGQKAADDVKKVVAKYKVLVNGAAPLDKTKKTEGVTRDSANKSTNPYQDQKKMAGDLLDDMLAVANKHKLTAK